jgi:protein-disulfide isomerase
VSTLRPWLLGLLLLASVPAGVVAEVNLTVHPAMVKGSSDAPVTIVEFSDYQ